MAGGFGWELLRSGLALGLVSALAFLGLRLMARRGLLGPRVQEAGPALRVLRRLSLGPRSSVYLVGVGERTLVLGVGEGGAPRLLADLGQAAPSSQTRSDDAQERSDG